MVDSTSTVLNAIPLLAGQAVELEVEHKDRIQGLKSAISTIKIVSNPTSVSVVPEPSTAPKVCCVFYPCKKMRKRGCMHKSSRANQ